MNNPEIPPNLLFEWNLCFEILPNISSPSTFGPKIWEGPLRECI